MTTTPLPLPHLLEALINLARAAGEEIMRIYGHGFDVREKSDASPVTIADERAEAIILAGLARLTPDIPVIAEESVARGEVPSVDKCFWLVDPLDGTREFIKRNGEFTVNIALIDAGVPILGVVFAPALGQLFAGASGGSAFMEDEGGRRALQVRQPPAAGLTVLASRSHGDAAALDAFLADYRVARIINAGSSLKLCRIATGEADLYPRLGRTMEWDIAAGQAVLIAVGGSVTRLDGTPLTYGKPGFENPHFVARGLVRWNAGS